jgi:hypothetical protein
LGWGIHDLGRFDLRGSGHFWSRGCGCGGILCRCCC